MKTYIITIQADGISHSQAVADKEDLEILKSVLRKIEKDASSVILEPKDKQQ